MQQLSLLLLTLILFGVGLSAIEVLDTPHWVSGVVWHDWVENGIREPNEPPFPFVKVTLLVETSSSLRLLSGEPALVEIQTAFTGVDGTYRFSCLSPGNYAVRFYIPENRPSRFAPADKTDDSLDSDVYASADGTMGETNLFSAESGGASHIDAGLQQYIFINQFSLTGDQWVPRAPNTARGVVYAALNHDTKEMYYRIIREEFGGTQVADESGGYFRGWKGENGPKRYSFADRYSPKENVWVNITSDFTNLFMGNMYTVIIGLGSFSDLARLRGQFYNFRNFRELGNQVQLSGRNVIPTPVDTSAMGMLDIEYNLDRDHFSYQLTLSGVDTTQDYSIGIYGPASVTSTGPLLFELDPTETSVNISSYANFDYYFSSGALYVQVTTPQYPNGLLRGTIQNSQQAVYHSIFNLTNVGPSSIARAEAVFTLDWRRAELYYYVYIEGLYNDETVTQLQNSRTMGWMNLDGPLALSHENSVKQGYFFGISEEDMNDIFSGRVSIAVKTQEGIELSGVLQNWF